MEVIVLQGANHLLFAQWNTIGGGGAKGDRKGKVTISEVTIR